MSAAIMALPITLDGRSVWGFVLPGSTFDLIMLPGTHVITAAYSGDGQYAAASG